MHRAILSVPNGDLHINGSDKNEVEKLIKSYILVELKISLQYSNDTVRTVMTAVISPFIGNLERNLGIIDSVPPVDYPLDTLLEDLKILGWVTGPGADPSISVVMVEEGKVEL